MDGPRAGSPPRVSVVIPALNEARGISRVLSSLPSDVLEVIIVDGGSTDGTVAAARESRRDVRVIQQPGTGKGDALSAGLAVCRGDAVVVLEADGSTDGAEIPRFVEALIGSADAVRGSRFRNGRGGADAGLLRRAGIPLSAYL